VAAGAPTVGGEPDPVARRGAVALLLTLWTQGTLMTFIPVTEDIPLSLTIAADHTVLLATLAISVLTGVIFGILPAN